VSEGSLPRAYVDDALESLLLGVPYAHNLPGGSPALKGASGATPPGSPDLPVRRRPEAAARQCLLVAWLYATPDHDEEQVRHGDGIADGSPTSGTGSPWRGVSRRASRFGRDGARSVPRRRRALARSTGERC
jgi:hypothetical protein